MNDEQTTAKMRLKAVELFGEDNVNELPIRLTSEDFSFYSQKVPVCFFRLGVRNESKGIVYSVHHSKFNIDDNALKIGMQTMAFAPY